MRFPIHAPLKPRPTRTRGPRQHVEARMAAKPPTSAPEPVGSEPLSPVSTLNWYSPVCYCLFLSKLGNERIACASLCCNRAAPNAARAPTCEGLRVSYAYRQASAPSDGALAHKPATGSAATPRGHGPP